MDELQQENERLQQQNRDLKRRLERLENLAASRDVRCRRVLKSSFLSRLAALVL